MNVASSAAAFTTLKKSICVKQKWTWATALLISCLTRAFFIAHKIALPSLHYAEGKNLIYFCHFRYYRSYTSTDHFWVKYKHSRPIWHTWEAIKIPVFNKTLKRARTSRWLIMLAISPLFTSKYISSVNYCLGYDFGWHYCVNHGGPRSTERKLQWPLCTV